MPNFCQNRSFFPRFWSRDYDVIGRFQFFLPSLFENGDQYQQDLRSISAPSIMVWRRTTNSCTWRFSYTWTIWSDWATLWLNRINRFCERQIFLTQLAQTYQRLFCVSFLRQIFYLWNILCPESPWYDWATIQGTWARGPPSLRGVENGGPMCLTLCVLIGRCPSCTQASVNNILTNYSGRGQSLVYLQH